MRKLTSTELSIFSKKISRKKTKWFQRRVGDNLRCARLRRNMTQRQLAKIVGIGQYHVSRMEWGDQKMSIALLYRFAMALGIMPQELIDPSLDGRFWIHRIEEKGGDIRPFLTRL